MPISDLTGTTWYFNTQINQFEVGSVWSFLVDFTSNNETYGVIEGYSWVDSGHGENYLKYANNNVIEVCTGTNGQSTLGTWSNDAYKTIEITGGTDATNASLIAWLEANATQQVAPQPSASISIGNLPIDKAYFGNNEISAIYFGNVKVYEKDSDPIPDNTILDVNGNIIKASDGYLITTESVPVDTFTINFLNTEALPTSLYYDETEIIVSDNSSQIIEIIEGTTLTIRTTCPPSLGVFNYVKVNGISQEIRNTGSGARMRQHCTVTPQVNDIIEIDTHFN